MTIYMHAAALLLASTAAIVAAITVWAAESRSYWFWRALALWACVATMLPIRAYEPAMVLAISLPLVALAVRAARWLQERNAPGSLPTTTHAWRARFLLRDILLATTLLGLSLTIALHVHHGSTSQDNWLRAKSTDEIVVPAIAIALITALGWYLSRGHYWWVALVGLVPAIGIFSWELPRHTDWLYALDDKFGVASMAPNRHELAALVTLVGMTQCAALVAVLMWSFAPKGRWQRLRRFVGYSVLTIVGPALVIIYCQMLTFTPFPPGRAASTDERRIVEIAQRVRTINEDALATNELEATDPTIAAEMRSLYSELFTLLPGAHTLPGDLSSFQAQQLRQHTDYEQWRAVRILGRCLDNEAKTARLQGDISKATDYALAAVRLAAAHCHGGIMLDDLVGRALLNAGYRNLASVRNELVNEQQRHVMEILRAIEEAEEPTAVVIQRDMAYCERVYGWQCRLSNVVALKTNGEPSQWDNFTSFIAAVKCWRALNRLLQTHLAIRLYRDKHGSNPETLDQLVPDFLAAPLLDPFTNRPLVYKPDATQGSSILYSLGKDGHDDGGRFTKLLTYHQNEGYDLDVDSLTRP